MGQHDWLSSAFDGTVFTVFDTETTGLDPRTNRIVEIGGIRFDKQGISCRFNVLINPGMPMPSEVTKINGITDEMLRGQPEASSVIPDFMSFAGNSILIAHNAPFDISFVNEELSRLGLNRITNKVIDTRIFAKELFPALPKYSLQDLALRFGIEAREAHRAEDDARVCMELFLVCMKKLFDKNPKIAELSEIESTKAPIIQEFAKEEIEYADGTNDADFEDNDDSFDLNSD